MLTNSLLKDFLIENGLNVYKEESTRDVIGVEFNFGSRSYNDELKHINKLDQIARTEYEAAICTGNEKIINEKLTKQKRIIELRKKAEENQKLYHKISRDELREIYYINGMDIPYYYKKRDGTFEIKEIIHYKMLFRSTGKAKKGSCIFIRDELYDKTINYLRMGIKLPDINAPIVEISAYSPLIASGIIDKIEINPKNILILKDVDRFMTRDVISIETDNKRQCHAIKKNNYTLKNTLFDGQALIDSSKFPEWADGYILLREHFCKMATFSSNIQLFFKDYFKDEYETAIIKDMFGNEHYAKDIEVITTDNAMKWIKFGVTYEYWCDKVNENKNQFGIVKTAHHSKLGDVQKMSYQMVNSLDEDCMSNVMQKTHDYINQLKQNDEVFLEYLKKKSNFSNDYEVLLALVEQNPLFIRSSYFKERRNAIIKNYIYSIKNGELIQYADNLVIVGSPYAMLLYAASGDPNSVDLDDTFSIEDDSIQCYNKKFNPGEHLAFFRSPFNSKNNLTYLHNIDNEKLNKYFNLGELCIAVNLNGTDFQDRNNGSDQDSDSGYTTNQPDIVACAKKYYMEYPTIVNNIPKDKNVYNNTLKDFAQMDNQLSASQTDIGESSNLAQLAQSYACNYKDEKYQEYVCILSVIAQAAIDSAKRRFDIDITSEIKRIKDDMNIETNKYPSFWLSIKRDFNKEKINKNLHCPMNYVYEYKPDYHKPKESTIPISKFFVNHKMDINKKTCKRVEEMIIKYSLRLNPYRISQYESNQMYEQEEYLLLRSDFDELINNLKRLNISGKYLGLYSWLINRAFLINKSGINRNIMNSKINKNKSILLKVLYDVNKENLLKCFSKEIEWYPPVENNP